MEKCRELVGGRYQVLSKGTGFKEPSDKAKQEVILLYHSNSLGAAVKKAILDAGYDYVMRNKLNLKFVPLKRERIAKLTLETEMKEKEIEELMEEKNFVHLVTG